MIEGIGAEPNFGQTDIGESDMLGLTSFKYLLGWGDGTETPDGGADSGPASATAAATAARESDRPRPRPNAEAFRATTGPTLT